MEEKSPHEKNLFRVVVFGSALSFAFLGAIIGSMKSFFGGEAALNFSWRTIVGFIVGLVMGWLPWRWIGKKVAGK